MHAADLLITRISAPSDYVAIVTTAGPNILDVALDGPAVRDSKRNSRWFIVIDKLERISAMMSSASYSVFFCPPSEYASAIPFGSVMVAILPHEMEYRTRES